MVLVMTLSMEPFKQLSVLFHRGSLHPSGTLCFVVILSYFIFSYAACGSRSSDDMQKPADYDTRGTCGKTNDLGFSPSAVGDASFSFRIPTSYHSLESVCTKSHSFCFPSTLYSSYGQENKLNVASLHYGSGHLYDGNLDVKPIHDSLLVKNESCSSDCGSFKLLKGGMVSCTLNSREVKNGLSPLKIDDANRKDLSSCRSSLLRQKTPHILLKSEATEPVDGSFPLDVKITPPILDWGNNYLYFPSTAFLTVKNSCNDSILHIQEPFSTDTQFYSCNFNEILLAPGESASLGFVFLPTSLGKSSGQLILQTSLGGFLIKAKGYATESPFSIQPLQGLDVYPDGKLSKNLSLFNPFDEIIYVEEVTFWISVSQGPSSHQTEAICCVNGTLDADGRFLQNTKDQLVVRSGGIGSPLVAMRAQRNWEISPHSSETVIEIDLSVGLEEVLGAFCFQLFRASQNKSDIIMVPFESKVEDIFYYSDLTGFVSASLEGLVDSNTGEPLVTISLKNDGQNVLSFGRVIELVASEVFHIKYLEDLILFPGTITQVAVITCADHIDLHLPLANMSHMEENCKLHVMTNDSSSPLIEIPCLDVIHVCSSHQSFSSFGHMHKSKDADSGDTRAGYVGSTTKFELHLKAQQTAALEEVVLRNWKLQGTAESLSVLDDQEVLFPMTQIGSHVSKWISVKNPSQHPVIVQLILNSGEIVDECRSKDGLLHPTTIGTWFPFDVTAPASHGFSIPESAFTEAYVHPYGQVSLGPIFFYPSNQCRWRSSALIRNNISGVEWLPLTGFGELFSLALLEGSEPVQNVQFNVNMPISLNYSLLYAFNHVKEMASACSQQPISKELHVKNMGYVPLDVIGIGISGSECQSDGFLVHSCKGFTLEPGESMELLISYRANFSAASVNRDLELTLASGILAIPMRANYPPYALGNCKRSISWMRAKKSLFVLVLFASFMLMVFCCVLPQIMAAGSLDYSSKYQNTSACKTVSKSGRNSRVYGDQNASKSLSSGKTDDLFGSVGEENKLATPQECLYGEGGVSGKGMSLHVMPNPETHDLRRNAMERKASTTGTGDFDALEASPLRNLTVNTGKEKGKKRRRRKGPGAKLSGFLEFSSSQSGNSTPSSPSSPPTSTTPNHKWQLYLDEQSAKAQNPFAGTGEVTSEKDRQASVSAETNLSEPMILVKKFENGLLLSAQEPHSIRRKAGSAVLMPSATFPSATRPAPNVLPDSPSSVSPSRIAPHDRAPGSKFYSAKPAKQEDKVKPRDEYTYDIWGDHFSGLHVTGSSKYGTSVIRSPAEDNSYSFFLGGPQTLTTTGPLSRSVSRLNQEG